MVKIPRADDSSELSIANQPRIDMNAGTATGRAMERLGKSIGSLGSALGAAANKAQAEAEQQQGYMNRLAMLEWSNGVETKRAELRDLLDNGQITADQYEQRWNDFYQGRRQELYGKVRPANPRQQFDLDSFITRRDGYYSSDNASAIGGARRRETYDRISGAINGEIGKISIATPERFKENFPTLFGGISAMIEDPNAPLSARQRDQLRREAASQAIAALRSRLDKDDASIVPWAEQYIRDWQKRAQEEADKRAKAAPVSGRAGSVDVGVLTSGKSRRGAYGWARYNTTWNSLDSFQKAAAMSLMEADGMRTADARNVLSAMINRALKNGEDLGAHVSQKIYQPTWESTQEARLGRILRSPQFKEMVQFARARAAGEVPDTVNGATHFLASERTMLALEARNPRKYRSWRKWTGFNPSTGSYSGVITRDGSHAFLAPEGRFEGGVTGSIGPGGTPIEIPPEYLSTPQPSYPNTPAGRAAELLVPQFEDTDPNFLISPPESEWKPAAPNDKFLISPPEGSSFQKAPEGFLISPESQWRKKLESHPMDNSIGSILSDEERKRLKDAGLDPDSIKIGDVLDAYAEKDKAPSVPPSSWMSTPGRPGPQGFYKPEGKEGGKGVKVAEAPPAPELGPRTLNVPPSAEAEFVQQLIKALPSWRNKRQSVDVANRLKAKEMVKDQLLNIEKQGRDHPEWDQEFAQKYLKPSEIVKYNFDKKVNELVYEAVGDSVNTPSMILRKRLYDLEDRMSSPTDGTDRAVYEAAKKAGPLIRKIIELRDEDPALAVRESQEVRRYVQNLDPNADPVQARVGLFKARHAAQVKIGLPKTTITLFEADKLLTPLNNAPDKDRRKVAREIVENTFALYGPMAPDVIRDAIRISKTDSADERKKLENALERYEAIERSAPGDNTKAVDKALGGGSTEEAEKSSGGFGYWGPGHTPTRPSTKKSDSESAKGKDDGPTKKKPKNEFDQWD